MSLSSPSRILAFARPRCYALPAVRHARRVYICVRENTPSRSKGSMNDEGRRRPALPQPHVVRHVGRVDGHVDGRGGRGALVDERDARPPARAELAQRGRHGDSRSFLVILGRSEVAGLQRYGREGRTS